MRFCSNFTWMWSQYLSNNVRTDFRLQTSESVMATYKMPDRKINFSTEFAIKLFRATVVNTDSGSLKSLHT